MQTKLVLPDPALVSVAHLRDWVLHEAPSLRKQIAAIGDISLAEEYRRRLEALQKYTRDRETRNLLAAESRRTEVLIGKMLGPGEDTQGQRTDLSPTGDKLNDVPREDRHKFRLMAEHEELVEALLAIGIVSRNLILEKILRSKKVEDGPEIIEGDFRTIGDEIPDDSVTLILTDPPYAESALPLYDDLGRLASRVLVHGGSLVCYTGQATFPKVVEKLDPWLRYWWTFCLKHQHGGQQLPGKWVIAEWKPLLWFVKEKRLGREYVADCLRGSRPIKADHEWAQGCEEVVYLIKKLTEPGEGILDPFAGSGAFGRAAKALGRKFVGIDLQPDSHKGVASA
jgi:16S rRNA G966 N2-methylase RsmD